MCIGRSMAMRYNKAEAEVVRFDDAMEFMAGTFKTGSLWKGQRRQEGWGVGLVSVGLTTDPGPVHLAKISCLDSPQPAALAPQCSWQTTAQLLQQRVSLDQQQVSTTKTVNLVIKMMGE